MKNSFDGKESEAIKFGTTILSESKFLALL